MAAAVGRARGVQQAVGRRCRSAHRAAVLLRYHDLVLDHQDELLDLIQAENGKARVWAFEEIMDQAVTARYYARLAPRALKPHRRLSALPGLVSTREHHIPKGVVGVISPWNYPLVLAVSDALAALVAGNGIVIKPDSQTPFTALRAFELLEEAGLPEGLVQIVTGPGRSVGTAIIDAADYVMFTGSTATGRTVARQAGERLIGMSAELGGKNAMVVTEDVDLDRAVEGAVVASFANTGQLCISIERIYVEEPIADAVHRRASAPATRGAHAGRRAGLRPRGRRARPRRTSSTRCAPHVDDAVAKGARVVAGGRHRPDVGPLFYEPTVLADVTARDGPVPRGDVRAGGRRVPGGVRRRGRRPGQRHRVRPQRQRLLRRHRPGPGHRRAASWPARSTSTTATRRPGRSLDAPMGGMKASGLGRRHGREGLLKYTESQHGRRALGARREAAGPRPATRAGYARRFTAILRKAKHLPR